MDKNEYRAKLDQINDFVDNQDYQKALEIVDTIDWRRVRSARTLCMIGEIYEANKRYDDSRRLLLLAHQRAPIGKTVIYRLVELSIKMGDYEEAEKYFNNFVEVSPNDNSQYILKYKISRAKHDPIEEQIAILQEYKEKEYTERWSFELARLYAKAGMKEACIEECDDLILWFSEGKYVTKAMELKMKFTSLTPQQQEKYTKATTGMDVVEKPKEVIKETAKDATTEKITEPVVGSISPEEDKEIEEILKSVEFNIPKENPEDLDKTAEFKPFYMDGAMNMQIKAEAPQSKMFDEKDFTPGSLKTSSKEFELDLEALLAETANELAQAVAEETEEPVPIVEEVVEEETEEIKESVEEQESQIAPVALNLSEAMAAKAEAFDALNNGETQEILLKEPEILEEPEISEESVVEESDDITKVIPTEEVKEALEEFDLSEALEKSLEGTISQEQEEPEMEDAKVPENVDTTVAFHTAVEGLLRHHLTEEEHRRLFTYFFPIPGMSDQINEVLDTAQESACIKTSVTGNIIVTGREGSGKTRLSEGLIKALCKERQMEGAKVAYLTAEKLNEKDPATVVDTLSGGFLVIENAGSLKPEIVENLSKAMEFKTNRLTVILEDLKPGIRSLKEKYPDFIKKFDSMIAIPVFTNDELVSFAKTYAKELGYKIDNMAVLALYTLIGDNQNEENPVAVGSVREMMDEAIARASRKGRRPGKKVGKRHLDETGRIMLYEKDFDI